MIDQGTSLPSRAVRRQRIEPARHHRAHTARALRASGNP